MCLKQHVLCITSCHMGVSLVSPQSCLSSPQQPPSTVHTQVLKKALLSIISFPALPLPLPSLYPPPPSSMFPISDCHFNVGAEEASQFKTQSAETQQLEQKHVKTFCLTQPVKLFEDRSSMAFSDCLRTMFPKIVSAISSSSSYDYCYYYWDICAKCV